MIDKTPSRKVVELRKATPKDAVKIFRVIKETFGAARNKYPLVDEDATITWILQTILKGDLVYVAEVSGRVVGSLGFEVSEFPWASKSDDSRWYLSNVWFYVHPKYRTNKTAEALLSKAKLFAKENNVTLIFNTFLEQKKELEERFFSMQEVNYGGGIFIYETSEELSNGNL